MKSDSVREMSYQAPLAALAAEAAALKAYKASHPGSPPEASEDASIGAMLDG